MNRLSLLALAFVVAPATDPVTGPAGVYSVTTRGPTRVTSGAGWARIEWDAPGPVPPTPIPPTPPVPPAPVNVTTGPYTCIYVTDRNSTVPLTAGQAQLKESKTIAAALRSLNPANQWASVDITTATIQEWINEVKAAGTPCVLVLGGKPGEKGWEVESIPQPADEPSVVIEIQRLAAGGIPRTATSGPYPSPQAPSPSSGVAQERAAKWAEVRRLTEEVRVALSRERSK